MTSCATTAKPRPASPARTASIVALSASRLVCLAIAAIRLTTLPISADEAFSPSTLLPAAAAACAGIVGQRAGVAHLAADLVGRFREFFGRIGKVVRVLGRLSRQRCELLALRVDRAEHVGGRARAAAHRVGGALHVADHRREIDFDQVDGLADRREPRLRLIDGFFRRRRTAPRPRAGGIRRRVRENLVRMAWSMG